MFKNVNLFALFLAILVIAMFIGAGISIAEDNIFVMIICILIGCLIMGFGIYLKSKRHNT